MNRIHASLVMLLLAIAAPVGCAIPQASQPAAQGNCTSEVERRGYTVVSTGNFQQSRDGWQLDVRARDQRGRPVDGTCFVETATGDVSLYGFGWGGSGSIDSFEFSCASVDGKYRECQLPVDGTARLIERKSDAPCTEGRSWGQRGDRVWVDDGCRASFEVVRGGSGGGATGETIECRSNDGRYRECRIARGYVGRLERDYTGRCRKDSTWGNREGAIWVTSGCQGSFRLVASGGGSVSDNSGQQQRAEVHCRNEAKRQNIGVRYIAPARNHGAYWETTLDGTLRGENVRAGCRFYPQSNRAELSFSHGGSGSGGSSSGGSGSGGSSADVAVRACIAEAKRKGLMVMGNDPAQATSGGYAVRLKVHVGKNLTYYADCRYRSSDGGVELKY